MRRESEEFRSTSSNRSAKGDMSSSPSFWTEDTPVSGFQRYRSGAPFSEDRFDRRLLNPWARRPGLGSRGGTRPGIGSIHRTARARRAGSSKLGGAELA